jgi:PPM family protein phosphatase
MDMNFEVLRLTSPGEREVNQDAMLHLLRDDYALCVVADGLGGHAAGEKASQYFCEGMLKYANVYGKISAESRPDEVFSGWVSAAVDEMRELFGNDEVASLAHTTCAVLYVDEKLVISAHCGDSRIYRLNSSQIVWRTKDHSLPQEMLDQGLITEEQMVLHPEQNQLTRSINIRKKHRVEVKLLPPMEPGESFLLCSDGFWEYVSKDELLQLAIPACNQTNLEKIAHAATARAKGHADNLTVVILRLKK